MAKPTGNLILALNAGSSSLKMTLYTRRDTTRSPEAHNKDTSGIQIDRVLDASITNISSPPAIFKFKIPRDDATSSASAEAVNKEEEVISIEDHASAFAHFLRSLEQDASTRKDQIAYICHRVVHGGDYVEPVVIDNESYEAIEHLSDLAPLHNGAALSVIQACLKELPRATSIAYFDTMFHRSIPVHIASCALDQEIAKKRGLKKYGFHGLSYGYILRAVARYLKQPTEQLNLIVLHLGSGASICAIKNGQSLDTSMGLTPVSGLPGATRSGAIDPSLIFHYTNRAGRITHNPTAAADINVTVAEDIVNRKAGWNALAGTTDFGVVTANAELDDPSPEVALRNPNRLAYDLVVDRILNYIGSYHLKLDGEVDAIVFAGGIGEKSARLRETLAKKIRCIGFEFLNEEKNETIGEGTDEDVYSISIQGTERSVSDAGRRGRRKEILVCHTDEQFEMAHDCAVTSGRRW